jgi:solute carrier family 25 (mitochondrial adenine nucleotide translocator), member 4/5/6/31
MTIETTTSQSNSDKDSLMSWMTAAGKDAFAGAISGAIARTVTAPIERIKLILQLQGSSPSFSLTKRTASSNNNNNAWSVCRHVYRDEGILAFWRGNLQNVIRVAGQAALNFALMERYKQLAISIITQQQSTTASSIPVQDDQQQQELSPPKHRSYLVSFVAGGLAGGTATTILYPTEFLRTRLALDLGKASRQYRGMWDITTQILSSDGIRGIYKGYGISLVGSVLYRVLYLGGYDVVKNEWQFWKLSQQQHIPQTANSDTGDTAAMTWTERLILAQFVALSAGTICYPIDSVRRRMMMQAGKPLHEQLYHNSLQCFAQVWKREGIKGFFLGFGPNIFRSIGGALTLVAYDGVKGMLVSH